MTAHPTPAERLLAMLEDEQAFESLPAGEIRADLDAVGIDPARSIALARALAGGSGSPGGRLLGAIDLAEDAEDEIARLESADIEGVRAQISGGTAAAIAAEARRQAGGDSPVVAMRPRRRGRVLRWGGPLAGIAAGILLLFVVGAPYLGRELENAFQDTSSYLSQAEGGAPAELAKDEAAAPVARYAAPEADKKKQLAPAQDGGAMADRLADQRDVPADAPAPALVPPAPAAGLLGRADADVVATESRAEEKPALQEAPALLTEPNIEAEEFAAKPRSAEEAIDSKIVTNRARASSAGAKQVAAMAVVDPSQVPLALQSQALPDAGLLARVDEARRLAGGRPVIALYRIAADDGQNDFAQVPLQRGYMQQQVAPGPLTDLLGPDAANYDFILLPAE